MTEPAYRGNLREMPISAMAYIGDAVYELTVRLMLCNQGLGKSGALHRKSVKFVSASAQSEAVKRLLPLLTEEENIIYKRGRNSQPGSMPRNADPADYLAATGFEALIGYLYLKGDECRLNALLAIVLEDHNHE